MWLLANAHRPPETRSLSEEDPAAPNQAGTRRALGRLHRRPEPFSWGLGALGTGQLPRVSCRPQQGHSLPARCRKRMSSQPSPCSRGDVSSEFLKATLRAGDGVGPTLSGGSQPGTAWREVARWAWQVPGPPPAPWHTQPSGPGPQGRPGPVLGVSLHETASRVGDSTHRCRRRAGWSFVGFFVLFCFFNFWL